MAIPSNALKLPLPDIFSNYYYGKPNTWQRTNVDKSFSSKNRLKCVHLQRGNRGYVPGGCIKILGMRLQ
jgi:hypothetical protein